MVDVTGCGCVTDSPDSKSLWIMTLSRKKMFFFVLYGPWAQIWLPKCIPSSMIMIFFLLFGPFQTFISAENAHLSVAINLAWDFPPDEPNRENLLRWTCAGPRLGRAYRFGWGDLLMRNVDYHHVFVYRVRVCVRSLALICLGLVFLFENFGAALPKSTCRFCRGAPFNWPSIAGNGFWDLGMNGPNSPAWPLFHRR